MEEIILLLVLLLFLILTSMVIEKRMSPKIKQPCHRLGEPHEWFIQKISMPGGITLTKMRCKKCYRYLGEL